MGPRTARLFDQCSSCCQPSTLFARRLRQERRDRDRRGISSRLTYLACVAYVCIVLATLAETCGQFARGAMVQLREGERCRTWLNHSVNGLHVLHASRSRKKRIASTGLPVGTIGTRKNWGVNIDPHIDSFTAPLRPSYLQLFSFREALLRDRRYVTASRALCLAGEERRSRVQRCLGNDQ